MQFTEVNEILKCTEEYRRERNPRGYELARRLLETAAELDVSEVEFDFAVEHVKWWLAETKALKPVMLADVKCNYDAFVKAIAEGR